jgi:glycerate 2-kinase
MLRVLAAPDKFRGTATAAQVCAAIARAVQQAGSTCRSLPMSDGGEGLLEAFGGGNRETTVTGPAGQPVVAAWRMRSDGLAIIESARACGLSLAGGAEQNDPIRATSRGVGELIASALAEGAARLLIGLGGSATTDGGEGAVDTLLAAGLIPAMREAVVDVCCDVQTRSTDAPAVYGPQKGATRDDIIVLTARMHAVRLRYETQFDIDVDRIAGSGAAGGIAGGLAALGATLISGFDRVAAEVGLDLLLGESDLVITGEGRLDQTSLAGKVVGGVWRRAANLGVPTVAVVGARDDTMAPAGLTVLSLTELFGADRALGATEDMIAAAVSGHLCSHLHAGR